MKECVDPRECCRELSRVWEALGITSYTGKSASAHVRELRHAVNAGATTVGQGTTESAQSLSSSSTLTVSEIRQRVDQADKSCCTVCDAKKLCHVCGTPSLFACSDCRIDFGVSIYVCPTKACRDAHEAKCPARVLDQLASVSAALSNCQKTNELLRASEQSTLAELRDLRAGFKEGAERC
jgi:hypothetical protein